MFEVISDQRHRDALRAARIERAQAFRRFFFPFRAARRELTEG